MFKPILNKIKPTSKEEVEVAKNVKEFLDKINSKLKNAKAIVGGSFAKGTWLKGNHDVDVFVTFNNNRNMSERLEKAIKSCFKKYEKIHGSRDYFLVEYKGLNFELVPVLKIKNAKEAENITDVSPKHVNWVKKNSSEKLKDDIRLAKYFLKMNNCYGAETYVGGFSGYLVELLVIYYKGFKNFIKKASKWKYKTRISINKKDKFVSNQRFPLVVIDPVQPNRNASAALRKEKFDLFVDLCKKFSKNYSLSYFKEKKVNLDKYDLVFRVEPLDKGSQDVVGTKMLKAFETIGKSLGAFNFGVKNSGWYWKDYGYFYYKVKDKKLTKKYKHYGPPVKFWKDAYNFRAKYKNSKVEKGRLFVVLDRKITNLREFSKYVLGNKEIKKRVKNIKRV